MGGPQYAKMENYMRHEEVCRNTIVFAFTQTDLGRMIGLEAPRPNVYAGLLTQVLRDYHLRGNLKDVEDVRFDPVFSVPEK